MINSKTKAKPQEFLLVCMNNFSQLFFTYQLAIKKLSQHETNTQLFGSVYGCWEWNEVWEGNQDYLQL